MKPKLFLIIVISLVFASFFPVSADAPVGDYFKTVTSSTCTSLDINGEFDIYRNIPDDGQTWQSTFRESVSDGANSSTETIGTVGDSPTSGEIEYEPISNFTIPINFLKLPYDFTFTDTTDADGIVVNVATLSLHCSQSFVATVESVTNGLSSSGAEIDFGKIHDGRINPENYAPVALYCTNSGLQVYRIDADGKGQFDFGFNVGNAEIPSENSVLKSDDGIDLYLLAAGGYSVIAPTLDGKLYRFDFNGCPFMGSNGIYMTDPKTGDFVRTD